MSYSEVITNQCYYCLTIGNPITPSYSHICSKYKWIQICMNRLYVIMGQITIVIDIYNPFINRLNIYNPIMYQ